MKTDVKEKKDLLEKKIQYVKHEMERYFHCDEADLKFSNPLYYDDKFQVLVRFTLRKLHKDNMINTSNYYFDFEGEYITREGIWYEGRFYSYDLLKDFFSEVNLRISSKNNYGYHEKNRSNYTSA